MLYRILRTAKFLVDRQYYIAFVACSLPAVLFYKSPAALSYAALAYMGALFLATCTAYQWHHAFYHQTSKPASLIAFLMQAPNIGRLGVMALLCCWLPLYVLGVVVLLVVLSFLYSYPLLGSWGIMPLNRYGQLKPFVLSAVWVLASAYLPMRMMAKMDLVLLFRYSFMVWISCCLFDARDAAKDTANQVRTLANSYRPPIFHALLYLLVLVYMVLSCALSSCSGLEIIRGIAAMVCIRYYASCSAYVFEIAINGLLLFFALMQLFV